MTLFAPFPWFGGKSRAAAQVWSAIGDPACYVEPFGGSAALLLARPGGAGRVETYNDTDGLLVNAWRAMAADPDAVARAADWPVSEVDMHARHLELVERRSTLVARLEADPRWFDAEMAGWWVWGACCWIGSGWCSGRGPWQRDSDGSLVRSNAGQGIHKQLPHLGNAGRGIHKKLPHLGDAGRGIALWFRSLHERLRRVRITCGDWRRVITPAVVERHGSAAVVFDPPYPEGWSLDHAYSGQQECSTVVWPQVIDAALDLDRRGVKVIVCGYQGLWSPPGGWTERRWVARKGYAADGGERQRREVLWCSPECLPEQNVQVGLFGGGAT